MREKTSGTLCLYTHTHTATATPLQHDGDSTRKPLSQNAPVCVQVLPQTVFLCIEDKIKFYQGFENSLMTFGAVCFL